MHRKRCFWVPLNNPLYVSYHDDEWGVPIHDDHTLFEMLILEGMQAGLSWITILRKREGYRKAFDNFDIEKILKYDESKVEELMNNSEIIRNRLKINAVIKNAQAFLDVQKEHGSFDAFIWSYADNTPIRLIRTGENDVPVRCELSDRISKDLSKRGFKFIGSTIICAYMHAIGLIDGHTDDCFCSKNKVLRR